MSFWQRYWYGPVAAVRPYLFSKCLYLAIACDALVLMTERGRYGLDGFSVAHFRWLDAIHPTPSASWYVGILMLVSWLALTIMFSGPNRTLQIILTILFTYCWAMDRHDSYMHHYMLSLAMTAMIFFPRITAIDLFGDQPSPDQPSPDQPSPNPSLRGTSEAKPQSRPSFRQLGWLYALGLIALMLIYRSNSGWFASAGAVRNWIAFASVVLIVAAATIALVRAGTPDSPVTSAWAFRLLGATVGVIYVFTSLAKADAEWCGGYTLQRVGTTTIVLGPVERFLAMLGLAPEWFWSILATSVIPLELTISASYFVAITQDEPANKGARRWCIFAFVLANGLHLNNELMQLSIQWFGYYMMFLACFFFLPARVLMALSIVFAWPSIWLGARIDRWRDGSKGWQRLLTVAGATIVAAAGLVAAGLYIGLPGAVWSLQRAALCVIGVGVAAVVASKSNLRNVLYGSIAATALMGLIVSQSSLRFDYYALQGQILQKLGRPVSGSSSGMLILEGRHDDAIAAFERALPFADMRDPKTADMLCNLAASLKRKGEVEKAIGRFQDAIDVNPNHFLAHYNLANTFRLLRDNKRAKYHYVRAIAIKSDLSDAYINLGMTLEDLGEREAAIKSYRAALEIEPDAVDAKQLLESATRALEADRREK